jgi:hypothetical protein
MKNTYFPPKIMPFYGSKETHFPEKIKEISTLAQCTEKSGYGVEGE